MTSNTALSTDHIVEAHKQLFFTKQADADAEIMAAAFAEAEQAPDYMSRMRKAAEFFRKNAVFGVAEPLSEAEARQDIVVVASAYAFCNEGRVPAADWMKWIACCFRVQAPKASFLAR